ncbi:MAG TPA: type II toxin-antitoxin system prevent-host-death family antitoxin [Chromatiales bacterium]|nr:type II toxin-antitoxin system prevent-host-death family antitoxin [Chromatiales bacterium]
MAVPGRRRGGGPAGEREVGAYEAKAHLSELLRAVRRGERVTITHRGRPVARLVPYREAREEAVRAAIEALEAMPKVRGVDADEVREWLEEGRA